MHAGDVSAGDGSTDTGDPVAVAEDVVLRNLTRQREATQRVIDQAKATHQARIEQLNEDHARWLATVVEETKLLDQAIGERQRSGEEADGAVARHAEALRA